MRVILGKLLTFFLIFFLNACTGTYKLNDQSLEKEYFETFYKNNNKVILLSNDIKEFNKNVYENNKGVINFNNLPKYLKNKKNLKYGLVVKKSNLRARPTNRPKFESKDDTHFDERQYKELKVGEWVILHRTVNSWAFVSTYNVQGWVENKNLAFFNDYKSLKKYLNEKNFVVVTDKQIKLKDNYLDMGVKLSLIKENKKDVIVKLPKRNKEGKVYFRNLKLKKEKIHIGYLAYTKRNLIRQALKYLGTSYGWGGLYNGVDCSGFILNVYSVFGFEFPRNSSFQQNVNNNAKQIKNNKILSKYLNNKLSGSLVYFPGHIMIYLGKRDNKDYIIHAIAYIFDNKMKKYEIFKVVITDTDIIRKTGKAFKEEITSVTTIK